jgi:hypothetical protein
MSPTSYHCSTPHQHNYNNTFALRRQIQQLLQFNNPLFT